MHIETYEDFREYMNGLMERHVESVPPFLGTSEKLKEEIQDGMETTFCLLSPQFQESWDVP